MLKPKQWYFSQDAFALFLYKMTSCEAFNHYAEWKEIATLEDTLVRQKEKQCRSLVQLIST